MDNVKQSLVSVLRGYSQSLFEGAPVFIKHFSYIDTVDSEIIYNTCLEKNIKLGIPSEQDRLNFLFNNGEWSVEKEKDIEMLQEEIKQSSIRKNSLVLPSHISTEEEKIKSKTQELSKILEDRYMLIGVTAEFLATQYSDDHFLINSFYQDRNLTRPLFNTFSLDEIDYSVIGKLKSLYRESCSKISGKEIKKIALSNQLSELVFAAGDTYNILSKPISTYTTFQIDLFTYHKIYKRILENEPRPPVEMRNEPEKLESWFDSLNRKNRILPKQNSHEVGGSVVVGATANDIKEVFKDESVVSLGDVIKKNNGKRMPMSELIKLHQNK